MDQVDFGDRSSYPEGQNRDLVKSKEGVKLLESVLPQLSDSLRHALATTIGGRSIQALFLGLKPAYAIENDFAQYGLKDRDVAAELSVANFRYDPSIGIYNPTLVEAVIKENSEYFADISFVNGQIITPNRLSHIQRGLLFGYPKPSILDFSRNKENWDKFMNLRNEPLNADEKDLLIEYIASEADEKNELLVGGKLEFSEILTKHLPELSAAQKDTLLNRRSIEIPGFSYASYNPDEVNGAFPAKVKYLLEVSGMNALIASERNRIE